MSLCCGSKSRRLLWMGISLIGTRRLKKKDGTELHYFYCCNKASMKCKKSAKATKNEDGSYLLYSWDGQHLSECRPNSALAAVKKVRDAIKAKVLEDPSLKPSVV